MTPGDRLRSARRAAELSQRELARRSGIAQPNIAAYESGRRAPSAAMLQRLLTALSPRPSSILRRHRSEILTLAAQHKAGNVRVFGSAARGDDLPGSDLDLLVAFERGADLFDLIELVEALQDLLGVGVDVVSEGGLKERDAEIRAEAIPL